MRPGVLSIALASADGGPFIPQIVKALGMPPPEQLDFITHERARAYIDSLGIGPSPGVIWEDMFPHAPALAIGEPSALADARRVASEAMLGCKQLRELLRPPQTCSSGCSCLTRDAVSRSTRPCSTPGSHPCTTSTTSLHAPCLSG